MREVFTIERSLLAALRVILDSAVATSDDAAFIPASSGRTA
jgi:hypothetical protein